MLYQSLCGQSERTNFKIHVTTFFDSVRFQMFGKSRLWKNWRFSFGQRQVTLPFGPDPNGILPGGVGTFAKIVYFCNILEENLQSTFMTGPTGINISIHCRKENETLLILS